ncbi:hypothetical protein ACS0TY_011956 [Phlomoides rotata]
MDTRSLICDTPQDISSLNLRLLRVLKADDRALRSGDLHSIEATFQLVNSRYIAFTLLHEVSLNIGDIPTLRVIELDNCSNSAVISAKEMEEQEELGNEDLRVRIHFFGNKSHEHEL